MLLWTIQHKAAYDEMLRTGSLTANEDHIFSYFVECGAYPWLADQMKKRIGMPPKGVNYPVWAWYQWEGKRKRLDMRTHRNYDKKGSPIVLLTIDVPDDKVALSDFDMWHHVLNDWYLALDEKDDKENYTEEEKVKSWEKIFRIDVDTEYWNVPKSTQATMWEIKQEWVLKAEHFVAS